MELEELVEFWFDNKKNWFRPNEKFDKLCKQKFKSLLLHHNYIKYNCKNPLEVLGMIILLDQIPRNIFRGNSSAYDYDKKCLKICLDNLCLCNSLDGWYKIFFLMPLKHSEDIKYQKENLRIWDAILELELDIKMEKLYKRNVIQSKNHLSVIKKFGRFPKRNKFLGRESTEMEEKYLKENVKGFI